MGFANAYPPLHSAEHLLTAVLCRRFPTIHDYSSRLKSRKCVFEFHYDSALTDAEMQAVEAEVQAIAARNLPVETFIIPRDQANHLPNLHQVPTDADTVRVVRLGDADERACIGQHVAHTGEIINFRITTLRQEQPGLWRINFVVD
jgi:misacylated tRNA(Ala) deacylase